MPFLTVGIGNARPGRCPLLHSISKLLQAVVVPKMDTCVCVIYSVTALLCSCSNALYDPRKSRQPCIHQIGFGAQKLQYFHPFPSLLKPIGDKSMPLAKTSALLAVAFSGLFFQPSVHAQATVECMSHNYQYTECQAPLSQPQLVHQISSSACILNRSWGFNPQTRRIWVAEGCSGVFAEAGGYHHGRGDTYDENARNYDKHGNDVGKVVAGGVLALILAAALDDSSDKKKHTTSNNAYSRPDRRHPSSGYSGCHGLGCVVDDPDARPRNDAIDPRPQFDKQGNPNWDTNGNWQGCRGLGCQVDNPDLKN